MFFHPFTQVIRWLPAIRFTLCCQAELLQYLGIDVDIDGIGITQQRMAFCPLEITLVPVAHVLVRLRQLVVENTVVLLVHFPLIRVGFTLHELFTVLASPAGQKTNTGTGGGLVIDHKIRVISELSALPSALVNAGNFSREPNSIMTSWKGLQSPVGGTTGIRTESAGPRILGNRTIQHGHHIMTFKVSGVRQYQVGKRHRF